MNVLYRMMVTTRHDLVRFRRDETMEERGVSNRATSQATTSWKMEPNESTQWGDLGSPY